jgi:hypothetical protein
VLCGTHLNQLLTGKQRVSTVALVRYRSTKPLGGINPGFEIFAAPRSV